jgi:hypothetical protein
VDVIGNIGKYATRGPGEKEIAYPQVSLEQRQKNWKAVCAFYQRDWWQRAWIRQEVALGRMAMMLCGNGSISYSTAIDAARYIRFVGGVLDGSNFSSAETSEFRLPFGYHANELNALSSKVSNGSSFAPLGDVLMGIRGSMATDPRDMVYAMLGLADPEVYKLVPNYRSTVREVYIAATKAALMKDRHGIKVLGACQNPERRNGLPSWTPNLSENWKTFQFETNPMFRGIAWTVPSMKFVGDSLLIKGFHTDEIETISDMVQSGDDATKLDAILLKWKEVVGEASRNNNQSARDKEILNNGLLGRRPERAWIEFLSVMHDPANDLRYNDQDQITNDAEPIKTPDSPNIRLAQAYIGLEAEQVQSRSQRKLHAAMRKFCVGRRLFSSKQGTIGLVPGDAKVGDSVAIFHGADFPYILRKMDEEAKYVIVGDAWLLVYTRGSAASNESEMICIV